MPASWFQTGAFPAVCASSGATIGTQATPAKAVRDRTALTVGIAIFAGITFGLVLSFLPLLLIASALQQRCDGTLPLAPDPHCHDRRLKSLAVLVLLAGCTTLGYFTGQGWLIGFSFLTSFAFFVSVYVSMSRPVRGLRLQLSRDRQRVTVKRAHPDFIAATKVSLEVNGIVDEPRVAPWAVQ